MPGSVACGRHTVYVNVASRNWPSEFYVANALSTGHTSKCKNTAKCFVLCDKVIL